MKFGPVPMAEAAGKLLAHNIAGPDGQRLFRKGRPLTEADVAVLARLGRASVYVAELEPEDVGENAAARRVAAAVVGQGQAAPPTLKLSGAAAGRVNILAQVRGLLRVDTARLARVNDCAGITLATLPAHTPVTARQIVATVKIIPFAVPETAVALVERLAEASGVLRVDALQPQPVSLVLSGSPSVREKLLDDFAPLTDRLTALGAQVAALDFIPLEDEADVQAMAGALRRQAAAGSRLIVLAGETAIMDEHDLAPRALEAAGGRIECVGAPVDPGNLLMLGYLGPIPVLGAPGCARSRKLNIIDWVLPRLLAGEALTRADVRALGHGGLLEDAPERPQPRSRLD